MPEAEALYPFGRYYEPTYTHAAIVSPVPLTTPADPLGTGWFREFREERVAPSSPSTVGPSVLRNPPNFPIFLIV